jgi:hypothetical protein
MIRWLPHISACLAGLVLACSGQAAQADQAAPPATLDDRFLLENRWVRPQAMWRWSDILQFDVEQGRLVPKLAPSERVRRATVGGRLVLVLIDGRPWLAQVRPPVWDRSRRTAEFVDATLRRLDEPHEAEGLTLTRVAFADGELSMLASGLAGESVQARHDAGGLQVTRFALEGPRTVRATDASALAAAEPAWHDAALAPLLRQLADGADPLAPRAADRPVMAPKPADVERLADLLEDLAAPDPRVRQQAQAALTDAGDRLVPAVRTALENPQPPAIRRVLEAYLGNHTLRSDDPPPDAPGVF